MGSECRVLVVVGFFGDPGLLVVPPRSSTETIYPSYILGVGLFLHIRKKDWYWPPFLACLAATWWVSRGMSVVSPDITVGFLSYIAYTCELHGASPRINAYAKLNDHQRALQWLPLAATNKTASIGWPPCEESFVSGSFWLFRTFVALMDLLSICHTSTSTKIQREQCLRFEKMSDFTLKPSVLQYTQLLQSLGKTKVRKAGWAKWPSVRESFGS